MDPIPQHHFQGLQRYVERFGKTRVEPVEFDSSTAIAFGPGEIAAETLKRKCLFELFVSHFAIHSILGLHRSRGGAKVGSVNPGTVSAIGTRPG